MDTVIIACNFLDHRKIKMIRNGPEGDTLVLLWLLMLAEAGKCNRDGYLMVSDSLPYTAETLSIVSDIPLPAVRLGLIIFTGLEMISKQNGVIFIRNWKKYQRETEPEARPEKNIGGALAAEGGGKGVKTVDEEEQAKAEKETQEKEAFWASLSDADRESFRSKVIASMTPGFKWPAVAITAVAKSMAWERCSRMNTNNNSMPS